MSYLSLWRNYTHKVNQTPWLKELRDWVEENSHGFGDRPLYWMWYEILQKVPENANCLEIGVFKGQTLALWALISKQLDKPMNIYGVTPLTSTTDSYHTHEDINYDEAIHEIHTKFNLPYPHIIKGLSQDVYQSAPRLDVLFIDGSHDEKDVRADVEHYVPLVDKDGYVVFDDASCNLGLPLEEPSKDRMWYAGLDQVSRVADEFALRRDFMEVAVIGHNRCFKRVS